MSNPRRRKSTVSVSVAPRADTDDSWSPALQLERLEQETTLVLQEIDHNLSRANSVINDRMFPILKKYASATSKVWENAGFWKNFMEEAADVEIKTLDDKLASPRQSAPPQIDSPASESGDLQNLGKSSSHRRVSGSASDSDRSSSPDRQLEASTPQNPRSRTSLASPDDGPSPQVLSVNRGSTNVAISPKKRTPRRSSRRSSKPGSESDARRSSILQNFLNSSPTLPEPPVLMSELGRAATTSSSSVHRPEKSPADLGRLSPIAFPIATPGQGSSTQRFPTSAFGSNRGSNVGSVTRSAYGSAGSAGSALRNREHTVTGSPLRRTPIQQYQDDSDLPAVPATTAVGNDESDELPVPELQTIQLMKKTAEGPSPKRRRFEGNDPQNVFLESPSSRNTSTLYHMASDRAPAASGLEASASTNAAPADGHRSMSQIFEDVLLSNPARGEDQAAPSGSSTGGDATHTPSVLPLSRNAQVSDTHSGAPPEPENADTGGAGAAETEAVAASDATMNSSDLGSFLGERWRNLSNSLRK